MNNTAEVQTSKRNVKINGYSSSVIKAKKAARREEALTRAEKYGKLSVEKKIALVEKRLKTVGGEAKRELARLRGKTEVVETAVVAESEVPKKSKKVKKK